MRIAVVATVVVAASLILVSVLGVASAETTTTTTTATPTTTTAITPPLRTVSVQGVAIEPIEQSASAATATGVYRQAMASAVSDGQTKAQFLASQAGATLGQIQSVAEGGGYIQCAGNEEGYLGEQPDFGSAGSYATPEVAPRALAKAPVASRPAAKPRKPKRKKKSVAKKTSTATCTLSTQVSLVYALS
jgi:Protein of unknown function (DUF541)